MSISGDVFLLLTRPDGKAVGQSSERGYGTAAGAVADLALQGLVELSDDRDPTVRLVDGPRVTEEPLATATSWLDPAKKRRLSSVVQQNGRRAEKAVGAHLASKGVVEITRERLFGFGPARYTVRDPAVPAGIRSRLVEVLRSGNGPRDDLAVLGILSGLGMAAKSLDTRDAGWGERQIKQMVADLSPRDGLGHAVGKSMDSFSTALTVGVLLPTALTLGQG